MKGLEISQIDALTPAGLYTELCRLFSLSGGSVTTNIAADTVRERDYTIFTCVSQHVTGPTMEIAIKKTLVMERFREENRGVVWSSTSYCEWANRNNVPAHLRP